MRVAKGAWLSALLLASSACTVVSDFSVHQCTVSADCDLLEGAIQRCEDGQCVPGCENNHHCAAFDHRAPICPSAGAECSSLTSEDGNCYVSSTYDDAVMGNLTGADLNIVGAFASSLTSSLWLTLDLATQELNGARLSAAEGLAPTLAVLCKGDAASVADSMNHLVNRLGVSSVMASLEQGPLQTVRGQPSLSGKALLISPHATSAAPAGADADLLWYLGGNYGDTISVYSPLIQALAALAEPALPAGRRLRIASLVSAAAEDKALADAVAAVIDLSGRTADYLLREDRFRRFELSDGSPDDREQTLAALRAYAPDLILSFIGGDFAMPPGEPRASVIQALEVPPEEGTSWTPFYLFGPRAQEDTSLLRLANESEGFRARALGISADRAPDTRLSSALQARFATEFPDAARGSLSVVPNAYDALYYLTYAAAVARQRSNRPSAAALVDGFARVADLGGECIEIGPTRVSEAAQHIAAGQSFQLCGTTGASRFTVDHARNGPPTLFCWADPASESDVALVQTLDTPIVLLPGVTPDPACARAIFAPGATP